MITDFSTCENCAYAVLRDKPQKFAWCPYKCTLAEQEGRRLIYKYAHDTCADFLASDKPRMD